MNDARLKSRPARATVNPGLRQHRHPQHDTSDVFQIREIPVVSSTYERPGGGALQRGRDLHAVALGNFHPRNETRSDDVLHTIYSDVIRDETNSRSSVSSDYDLGYDLAKGNSTELGPSAPRDSKSMQNRFHYPHYVAVPFNTDENSNSPHFDAQFFPEQVNSSEFPLNETSSLSDTFRYSSSWDPPSHQHPSNSSVSPFHLNAIFHTNVNNLLFDNSTASSGASQPDHEFALSLRYNSTTLGYFNDSSAPVGDIYTWSILMMAPLVIFGVGGNTLVILAISLEKRLQNVTNYFLLSLAVTDLLVSLMVMPLSIINVFTGHWMFGLLLCDFFVTSDVLMCTSSILHLCTISLERYIGIRYPLWTKYKSKRIVLLKIVLVWTIALAITSPITVLGVVRSENILREGKCNLTNEPFLIYGSIFAFFIPLGIMVLMYGLTVNMLRNQARLNLRRGAEDGEGQPMIRRSTSRRNWQMHRKFYGRELLSVSSAYSSGRGEDYEHGGGMSCPVIHQRFGTMGAGRNNTIPLCHHHHHLHMHRHYESRLDPASAGGTNLLGSNSSINSLHRSGRSGGGGGGGNSNNNGANNNSANNNGKNLGGGGGGVESNGVAMNNALNLRRGRYASQQNGRTATGYTSRTSPPDYAYCNGHEEEITSEMNSDSRNCCSSLLSSSSSSSSPSSSNREPKRLRELVRKHHVAVKAANILLMKRDGQPTIPGPSLTPPSASSTYAGVRRDNSVRTEQKASKVLGVVFMIFVICWAPFFTVNILTPLCSSCNFESTLVTAFVWLGYVSSTLNPIIYTIFNNIFRITFIKLLCCRYRLLHRARRTSNLPGLRNGMMGCNTFGAPSVSVNVSSTTTASMMVESNC